MICIGCRKDFHDGCRGGTWCPCQHRTSVHESAARIIEQDRELLSRLAGLSPMLIQVPEGRDADEFAAEVNAAIQLTRMAQEDGLGDHGSGL